MSGHASYVGRSRGDRRHSPADVSSSIDRLGRHLDILNEQCNDSALI